MNFLNFEYVMTIQKMGTIRGAAEELYISPQALSEHLKKLERELGTSLFHRTKPLTLTEAGVQFVECAKTCLEARQRFETELQSITLRNDRHISLGVPTGMPPPMLLGFLNFFRHIHPELTVTTAELPTRTGAFHEIPEHIDVVIGEFQGESGKLIYTPILQSHRFVVVIHRDLLRCGTDSRRTQIEAAASEHTLLDLSEFRDFPFVLKRKGSIVREYEDRLFQAAHMHPTGDMETGDMELTVRLVLLGQAVVYLPEPVARANFLLPNTPASESPVLLCPVRVSEQELWQLTAGYHRYRSVPEGVGTFIAAARSFYADVLGGSPDAEACM